MSLTPYFPVHSRQHTVEEFHHRHLGSETPPHRAKLKPDDAGSNNEQMLGTSASDKAPVEETMRFSSMSMPFNRATSEPVAMTIDFTSRVCVLPAIAFHFDLARRNNSSAAKKRVDLVLLEEEIDTPNVAFNALILESHHGLEVEPGLRNANTHLAQHVARLLE